MGNLIKIRIRDKHPGPYFREIRNLNSMMRNRIRYLNLLDPGPGFGIRDKHLGSATLHLAYVRKGFLIYEEMRKYLTIYEEAVSHI
jgi:hypothetical protein